MDWSNELLASLTWLAVAFPLSLAGLAATFAMLGRYTVWGRQVVRLAWP